MAENFETNEQEFKKLSTPESGELLEHLKEGSEASRKPIGINLNQEGIDKAARETFETIRAVQASDTESGMHTEAGVELPLKIENEEKKRDVINRWIVNPDDPDKMTKFLEQNMN